MYDYDMGSKRGYDRSLPYDLDHCYLPWRPLYKCEDNSYTFTMSQIQKYDKNAPSNYKTLDEARTKFREIMGDFEYFKRCNITANCYMMNAYMKDEKLSQRQKDILKALHKKLTYIPYDGLSKRSRHARSHMGFKEKSFNIIDIYEIMVKNDWKCGYSGMDFDLTKKHLCPSIDRCDSDVGYVRDNIQIVLTCLNMAKNHYNFDDFKMYMLCLATGTLIEQPKRELSKFRPVKQDPRTKWVPMNVPLQMKSQIYAKIFYNSKDRDWFEFTELKNELKIEDGARKCLQRFYKEGYINRIGDGTKQNPHKWKFKSEEEIIQKNEQEKFNCVGCKLEFPVKDAVPRKTRQKNLEYDCNFYCTMCCSCRNKATINSRDRSIEAKILKLIQPRKKKAGNITRENIHKIVSDRCAVTGVPLSCDNPGAFNNVSPDRIDGEKPYDVENTRCVALMVNFMRKNYEIEDSEIRHIIRKCSEKLNRHS